MKKFLAFYLLSTTLLSTGAFAAKKNFPENENELHASTSIAKKSYDFQKDPITCEDFFQKIGAPEVYGLEDERSIDNQRITFLKEKIIECHEHKIQDLSTLKHQLNLTGEISSLALSLKEDPTSAFFFPGLQDLEAHAESRRKYLSFLAQREEQINTTQGRWDLFFKYLERRVGFPTMESGNVLRGTGQLDGNPDIDTMPIPHLILNQEAYWKWQEQASINPSTPSFLLWLESQKRNETRDELLLRAWRKNGLPRIQEVYNLLVKHKVNAPQQRVKEVLEEGKKLLKSSEAMNEVSEAVQQVHVQIEEDKKINIYNQIIEDENGKIDFFQSPFWLYKPLTSWDNFLSRISTLDDLLVESIKKKFPLFGLRFDSEEYKKVELVQSLLSRWVVARQLEFLGLPMELAIGDENYRSNEEEFKQLKELLGVPYYLTCFGKANSDSFYNLPEWFCNKKNLFKIIPEKLPELKLVGNELIVKDGFLSYTDHIISPVNGYGLYILDKQKKFRVMLGRYHDFEQRSLQLVHTDLVKECEPVLAAGIIEICQGKITYLSDESGHYKPRLAHFKQAITFLQEAIAPYATIKHFCVASRAQTQDKLSKSKDSYESKRFFSDLQSFEDAWEKRNNALSFSPSLDYLKSIPGENYEWGTQFSPGGTYGRRSFRFDSLLAFTDGKLEKWEPLQEEFATIRANNVLKIKSEARTAFKKRIIEALKASKISSSSSSMVSPDLEERVALPSSSTSIRPLTFRTAGAKKGAEIKHSAIYASFFYQNNPGAAYSLIINHQTKDKGSEVRVFNPNTKTYIDLGRLSPSMGFSDQVFNLSSLFASTPTNSSGPSIMKTELNFTDGISDIHSFTIKSGKERLMEVILGDQDSEKQTGVYVYAPEISEKLQEWSEVRSGDVE